MRRRLRAGGLAAATGGVVCVVGMIGSAVACSLLAPSDEELMGGLGPSGGGGTSPSSMPVGAAGVGGRTGAGGAGGSAAGVEAYPVLPIASGGSAPIEADEPPSTPPDAGATAPAPCVDCESIRLATGPQTVELGTPGGSLYMDICPRDQVVVGIDYEFTFGAPADFGYFTSVAIVCGELVPTLSAGRLDVVIGELLPQRGAGAGAAGMGGRCPSGEVVTGFEGVRNFDGTTSEIRELTLHCAAPVLDADASVLLGMVRPAPPMSADFAVSTVLPDEVLPLQVCPVGQVVRGAAVHAGTWVDGVSLVCGEPAIARPDGEACAAGIECLSGRCAGTCQPRPCTPPAGCTCELFEDSQRAFCPSAQTQQEAGALCAAAGMQLAYAADPIGHGWLRTSAGRAGIQAAFWLGADDRVSEGDWLWAEGRGAVDLVSELWDRNEQRGGTAENCMAMTRDGHWDDVSCELTLPFVCDAPP